MEFGIGKKRIKQIKSIIYFKYKRKNKIMRERKIKEDYKRFKIA